MARLIFDIETIGENFDALDETTQHALTRWVKRMHEETSDAWNRAVDDIKNGLGFSPWTGRIVAIGVLDGMSDKGVVYFDAPGEDIGEVTEGNITLKQFDEKEMLARFWEGAKSYDEFVTFNGRVFDVPFLVARSMVHKIRPTKNLMEGRYAYQQKSCRHVDLADELTFQGAVRRQPSLHLVCRALGIKSPKSDGVTGDDVSNLFKEKKYLDIARYNVGDIRATKELYEYWQKYVRF